MSNQLLERPKRKTKFKSLRFEDISVRGYEKVVKIMDESVGLTAFVAIHNTTLGPALGGTRIQPYASLNDALNDVLRLSKGMTYKSAVAEVGFGGGKSVILADSDQKAPELLRAFGAAIETLGGLYICAEDMGCTTEDVKVIREETKYVVGLPHEKSSGDPGPFTAWGTFRGIQSVVKRLYNKDSLEGITVAVQGLGNVGKNLVEHLFWAGANLILSERDPIRLEELSKKYAAKAVSSEEILSVECDVFAPYAGGGIVNGTTIPNFKCKAIAGCANNQLENDEDAKELKRRGILYAPDFVINAGGLLSVSCELEEDGYNPASPRFKAHHIYDTLLAIYEISEKNKESTHEAALSLAEYRIKYGIGKRILPPIFHHSAEF